MSFPELLHINVPSRLWEWEKSTEHIFFVTWFSDLVFTVTLDLHRHHLGSVRVTFVCFLLFLHRLSLSPSGPSVFLYHLFNMKLCDLLKENFETASTEMWILGGHENEEYTPLFSIYCIQWFCRKYAIQLLVELL